MGVEAAIPLREATYEDIAALPEHLVGQIVDGELHVHPRPASPHARSSSALDRRLGRHFDDGHDGPGGWVILPEPELHFPNDRGTKDIVVPDLAGCRRERMPEVPRVAHFELAPDWTCEILSPGRASFDRVTKMNLYARQRVNHVWLVDPDARVLEVYRLERGLYVRVLAASETDRVRAEPFEAMELALEDLWRM